MTAQTKPKYPRAKVAIELAGPTGNAFVILGRVDVALKEAGATEEERDAFRVEATAGNYQKLLKVCGEWVQFRTF